MTLDPGAAKVVYRIVPAVAEPVDLAAMDDERARSANPPAPSENQEAQSVAA